MKSASSNTDNTETKTSVHEGFIEEASLVSRHAAILTSLTVENKVGSQHSTTNDGSTVHQLLSCVAGLGVEGLLHVGTAEGILKGLARLAEDGGSAESLSRLGGLERRVVDEASSIGKLRSLAESRRDGEGTPKEESHGDGDVCRK